MSLHRWRLGYQELSIYKVMRRIRENIDTTIRSRHVFVVPAYCTCVCAICPDRRRQRQCHEIFLEDLYAPVDKHSRTS